MKLIHTSIDLLPACIVIVELQFQGKTGARQKVYQLITELAHSHSVSSRPSTKQNNLLGWSDLWRYQPTASRYCFPQRKFVKIRLTGTTSHLLQTRVINYEFNNHLSTMLRVINCLAWCLPVAIYFLARRSKHSAITLQTMYSSLLSCITPSFHHSPHTSYQTTES